MSVLANRILDAAIACVARVGLAKTTLDDVAREAGCARATVYRHFPGKRQLIEAAVGREADRVTDEILASARRAATLADAAVGVVTTGARGLADHDALRTVMAVEPEVVLPYISFERGDAFLADVATRLAPAFTPYLPVERALRLAEWLARITFSYLCSPEAMRLVDAAHVRTLVEDFVLPGFVRTDLGTRGVHP